MIEFSCFKIGELIWQYQEANELNLKKLNEKLGSEYFHLRKIRSGGCIPWARNLQKMADTLGYRFVLNGKEFRYDNYHESIVAMAKDKKESIAKACEKAGVTYSKDHLSTWSIQYLVEAYGEKIYLEKVEN